MRHNRARLEDVRWMVETGESATGAAKRLGITLVALEKWCRNNARDEWKQLRANDNPEWLHNHGQNQWTTGSAQRQTEVA